MGSFPPQVKKELTQIVLSPEQDQFYKENMFKNFGDLGIAMKDLADEYQKTAKINQNIKSLEDMKKFISSFPEFKKLSANVSKHWALMEELQRQVAARKLLDLSELEQTIACHQNEADAQRHLDEAFGRADLEPLDLLRLVMIYSLRYETSATNNLGKFLDKLKDRGLDDEQLKLIGVLRNYAGVQKRTSQVDLFQNRDILSLAKSTFVRGLVGVSNVFSQHEPLLHRTINQLLAKSLPEAAYPFIDGTITNFRPQQIIVFVVGGATYEEALFVNKLNTETPNLSVVLGGSTILSPKSFLRGLLDFKQSRELKPGKEEEKKDAK